MNYERKYKEALEKAQKALEVCGTDKCETARQIFSLFPELKESEDERIRKEILQSIRDNMVVIHKDKCIAWLEKQEGCEYIKKDWLEHIKQSWYKEGFIDGKYSGGTSKEWTINDAAIFKEIIDFLENGTAKLQHDLTKYANWLKIQFTPIEKQGEQKHADKSEPKFHEGDWVVTSYGKVNQVIAVDEDGDGFTLDDDTYFSGSWKDSYHLWTIQDAKDGDVLVASDESLFIFAKVKDNAAYYHFSLCKNGSKEISDGKHAWETVKGCHPATKEQRDTLFAKMKEAGYTWNADKKQLKKIEQKPAEEYSFNIESELFHQLTKEQQELWKKEIEQAYNAGVEASDEWSEEDEKYIKDLTDYFIGGMSLKHTEENIIAWIKSLGHQQKQEWSEEDEAHINSIIDYLLDYKLLVYEEDMNVANGVQKELDWLKSLQRIGG